MNDLALANDIERWLADDPDHMGLHSLSEAQWRAIVAALRRGSERPPSGEMVMVPREPTGEMVLRGWIYRENN